MKKKKKTGHWVVNTTEETIDDPRVTYFNASVPNMELSRKIEYDIVTEETVGHLWWKKTKIHKEPQERWIAIYVIASDTFISAKWVD